MRYLTYFRPPRDLEEDLKGEGLIFPASGLHCTLVGFAAQREKEGRLLEVLANVSVKPFSVQVKGREHFDNNGSYVLR